MRSQMIFAVLALGASLGSSTYPETEPPTRDEDGSIAARYRDAAEQIVRTTLTDNEAYDKLQYLCIGVGHRLSGSPGLERAIDWAGETLKKDGAENVHRETVMVPHWVRGQEAAWMVTPRSDNLHVLGLGGSVGTPEAGIFGEVLVVEDEAALDALGEGARGRIVLFNKVMPQYDPGHGSGYGVAVKYRTHGARLAAAKGAIACLVRSATANSLQTPHTGAMRYGDAKVKIPAAAISTEDADTIAGLRRLGAEVRVHLKMEAKTLPDAESANVVGELRGSTWPDEVVVIGGHIDSWDVGHGTHDDAGGCVIAMEVINVLRKLNMIPKRTIRVVLWVNEENGLRGGIAYAKDHADEMGKHVVAIESDAGVFRPTGFSLECTDKQRETVAAEQMRDIMSLFSSSVGEMTVRVGGSGADISPMKDAGVMLMGQRVEGARYFDYHHSPADTLDKVNPEDLSKNVAVLATVAYILADMPQRLGERLAP